MRASAVRSFFVVMAVFTGMAAPARAQEATPEDQAIETMRQMPQVGASDQRRIADWVQTQVDKVTATPKEGRQAAASAFRKNLKAQYENSANSPAFKGQLAAQTAQIAAARLADPATDRWVAFALARALVDFNNVEAMPGLLAGLKSREDAVRLLAAEGLAGLRDRLKAGQVVEPLREAGLAEASPVVLSRIYTALAYPGEIPAVLDAYLATMDKRISARRGGALIVDGAEVAAFEFFRTPAVLGALSAEQKSQLAQRVAVLLRLDAQRYNSAQLSFEEQDRIERSLDAEESILAEIAGAGRGGKVRDEIATGGHDSRSQVVNEVYKWVGNASTSEAGALNAAPFNVPIGAP